MGDGHAHASAATAGSRHRKPLLIAFALTATYMVVEFVAGYLFNSLALLSDALHMGTDVLGLGMALAAVRLAARPGPAHRTYGTYRVEVVAALANGVLLFGVAFYILYEAIQRLRNPVDPTSAAMLIVAVIGLAVNLVSFKLLTAGAKESLNVKGAYFEVLSDMLGSIGVIIAADRRRHHRMDLRRPGNRRRHRTVHPAPHLAAHRPSPQNPARGCTTQHRRQGRRTRGQGPAERRRGSRPAHLDTYIRHGERHRSHRCRQRR